MKSCAALEFFRLDGFLGGFRLGGRRLGELWFVWCLGEPRSTMEGGAMFGAWIRTARL